MLKRFPKTFKQSLRSPRGSWSRFYFWYALVWLNYLTVNKESWEAACWDYIKCEMFYVAGQCRHSGNCCDQLSIIQDGEPIKTLDRWNEVRQKDSSYDRFEPNLKGERIQWFSCHCLTSENVCSDYEGRPHFCQTYPYSNFIRDDIILADCGYRLAMTQIRHAVKHPGINARIEALRFNNYL